MKISRLEELSQKYALGNLSSEERDELAAHLSADDAREARRHFRLVLKADAYLQEAAAEIGTGSKDTSDSPSKILSFERGLWALGGVAAALVVGLILWPQVPEPVPPPTGVASIHRVEGLSHTGSSANLLAGDLLQKNERFTVTEGTVELVFEDTGVHAVATAPLSMTVEGTDRVFLHEGDLKLTVPPQGIGFIVEPDEREITDLGTSFVVTAGNERSKVLVLDGLVSIGPKEDEGQQFMVAGETAPFGKQGTQALLRHKVVKMPELPFAPAIQPGSPTLNRTLFALRRPDFPAARSQEDAMGNRLLPLIRSGFQDKSSLQGLIQKELPPFTCIAGAYNHFGAEAGLAPETVTRSGWIAWYNGKLQPPKPGRYRFLGYADNQLFASVNGKPVFEGSRYDSALRKNALAERQNFPAWPCLNSLAGFAAGPWFEVGTDPVEFNLLFGEKKGNLTYGLLLIEREGDTYDETSWGQPKWPIFLTRKPDATQSAALESLQGFLDQKLLGGFSLKKQEVWKIVP